MFRGCAGAGRWGRGRRKSFLAAPLLLLLLAGVLHADWDFDLISQRAEQLYGPLGEGKARIDEWQALLERLPTLDEPAQLEAVNRFFNARLRFRDDIEIWRQNDYWATPVEALRKGAGDCEDFAIAKYFTLREAGVASEKLRITYVKALRLNQAHMVLTYYATPDAMPLVLDNLVNVIRPASERSDLLPVYAFNAEGMWLAGKRGGKQVGDAKRLSRWQELLKKMTAEGFPVESGR